MSHLAFPISHFALHISHRIGILPRLSFHIAPRPLYLASHTPVSPSTCPVLPAPIHLIRPNRNSVNQESCAHSGK